LVEDTTVIPDPLHPAVVHFPIVFMMLLPVVGVGAWWAIRRGTPIRRAWIFPLVISAAVSLSAFVAVRTGEAEGERVQDVVRESVVDSHEERAELFLVLSFVVLGVTAVGLAGGVPGRVARVVALLGAVGLMGAGYRVGASGGDLVYHQGAARAYAVQAVPGADGRAQPARRSSGSEREDGDR
jgi:uncharacterized membrane protein